MFQIVVTESLPGATPQDTQDVVRLQMAVDRIDLPKLLAVLTNPPAPPRKRRKDVGVSR